MAIKYFKNCLKFIFLKEKKTKIKDTVIAHAFPFFTIPTNATRTIEKKISTGSA